VIGFKFSCSPACPPTGVVLRICGLFWRHPQIKFRTPAPNTALALFFLEKYFDLIFLSENGIVLLPPILNKSFRK